MLTAGDVRAIVSMKHGASRSEIQEKIYNEATEETSSSNSVAARPYTSVGLFMTFTAWIDPGTAMSIERMCQSFSNPINPLLAIHGYLCLKKRGRDSLTDKDLEKKMTSRREIGRDSSRIQPACKRAELDISCSAQRDEECFGEGAGWNSKEFRSLGIL